MDLLDRYLQAVRTYLPKGQQDDILKELHENLRSQIEDREGQLGRGMNEGELASLLKQHGHPMVVAASYRHSRYLIRPTLFPVYWFVLKVILILVAFGQSVAALVMLAQGSPVTQILGALFNVVSALLPAFGWVTIIFAILDLCDSRIHLLEKITAECNSKFDPLALPPIRNASDPISSAPISRAMTLFELFFTIAFTLWWIRIVPIRKLVLFMALGPVGLADKVPFQLASVWPMLFFPVLLLALAEIARQIYTLFNPYSLRIYAAARLITNAVGLLLLTAVIRANELLVLVPGTADPGHYAQPLGIVNLTLHYIFIFMAGCAVFECLKMIRRLIRSNRRLAVLSAR